MARLYLLPFAPSDLEGHWEDLREIPEPVLEAGIVHARRTRTKFPVPAELRADCDAAARRSRPAAVPPTSRLVPIEGAKTVVIQNPFGGDPIVVQIVAEPEYSCEDCDDTGRVLFWCGETPSTRWPWLFMRRCDRRDPHGDHDYAQACPCVQTNRTIAARKEAALVRFSQPPERAA